MERSFAQRVMILIVTLASLSACRGVNGIIQKRGGNEGAVPVENLYYLTTIKDILDAQCGSCHGETPAEGVSADFRLTSFRDVGAVRGVRSMLPQIQERLQARTMPPDPLALSPTDRSLILRWISLGAPLEEKELADGTVNFLAATTANEPADLTYAMKLSFANFPSGSRWSLFAVSEAGASSGGLPIIQDQGLEVTRVTWDTSIIATGTYYFYVSVSDGESARSFTSTGSVLISHRSASPLTYYKDTQAILNKACVPCHATQPSQGVPDTFALDTYRGTDTKEGVRSRLTAIKDQLSARTMPPTPSDLSEADRNKLISWIQGGALEGTASALWGTNVRMAEAMNLVSQGEEETPGEATRGDFGLLRAYAVSPDQIALSWTAPFDGEFSLSLEVSGDGGWVWVPLLRENVRGSWQWPIELAESEGLLYRLRMSEGVDEWGQGSVLPSSQSADLSFSLDEVIRSLLISGQWKGSLATP